MSHKLTSQDCKIKRDILESLFGIGINSTGRCRVMLDLMAIAESEAAFWLQLVLGWSGCDAVDLDEQEELGTRLILKHVLDTDFASYLNEKDYRWWMSLKSDQPLRVFRGCNSSRVGALSWTLNRKVAEGFAHGHRGLRNWEPVIAQANVYWQDVLFATNSREEEEVLIDFKDLEILQISPYTHRDET
jgi:hypothetical protein